ncbi:MAG TPA: S8 family serine peptidase [Acidobacteriaceae bacterium]|jgi:subtilisin family serine protease|nr:S8 family serine peptidase [Acidobacteriaceae bacterium]
MFLYTLKRTKVDLILADSEPPSIGFVDVLTKADSAHHVHDAARIVRASSRFFVDEADAAQPGRTRPHRAPTVYRDFSTQLLRCVYREIVIRFKTRVPAARRRAHLGDFELEIVRTGNSPHQLIVRDPLDRYQGDDLIQLANDLAERDDDIVYAAPNFVSEYRRTAPPLIPRAQWHLNNTTAVLGQVAQDIRAQQAWPLNQGLGVVVAVLDDGVDLNHPALRQQIWTNPDPTALDQHGRDYFLDPSDPGFNDPNPKVFNSPFDDATQNDIHGTPCAGLVGAADPNGSAFGVAPQCSILPIKIFHGSELASDLFIANAITYAAGIAPILSCSWHGSDGSTIIEDAITTAATKGPTGSGCAIFCSVGDDGRGTVCFPASLPSAIAIGSSTDEGLPASYSNSGSQVAMVAPSDGGDQSIFTCDVSQTGIGYNPGDAERGGADGLYTNGFGGTSASVPIAAGAAAVLLSYKPSLTAKQLTTILQRNADKVATAVVDVNGHSDAVGFGKINLFAALKAV